MLATVTRTREFSRYNEKLDARPGSDVKCGDRHGFVAAFSIPTGLCNSAQGCEERATLGTLNKRLTTPTGLWPNQSFPQRVAATPSGLHSSSSFSQRSSFLATMVSIAEV